MCQQVRVEGVELTYRAYQKVHNYKGGSFRLRPILITATATSLGLVPMLLSKGIGSEVQKPLALVVIWDFYFHFAYTAHSALSLRKVLG